MSKLPSIFHNNNIFSSNNKKTYNTFDNKRIINTNNSLDFINYFNKKIIVILNNGDKIEGILLVKRGNNILLDNGKYLNIKEIIDIK